MPLYAIQRVFDGKLLSQKVKKKGRLPVTWIEFDDHLPNDSVCPVLWASMKGAETAMRFWLKGGWVRNSGGGIKLRPKPERADFPVKIVEVTFIVQQLQALTPEMEEEKRRETSVLD